MKTLAWVVVALVAACGADDGVGDAEGDSFRVMDGKSDSTFLVEDWSWEAEAVLRLVNRADYDLLRAVGLNVITASSLASAPKPITSLTALDDVPFVGLITFTQLRLAAVSRGYGPALAEEYPPPNEAVAIQDTINAIGEMMHKRYATGAMPRDQHVKAHGCVKATLRVDDQVPPALRRGVFAEPGKQYASYLRFSNGDSSIKADGERDVRGFALKLTGVRGTKLLADEATAETQDFLLINHPTLMVRNVLSYADFTRRANSQNPVSLITYFLSLNPADWGLRGLRVLLDAVSHKIASPLESRYFSTTPYLLGDRAVKYGARPCTTAVGAIPAGPPADYLRDALKARLDRESACFELLVQPQTDPRTMPIEDPTVEWSESESPFIRVATIEIPKQDFDTPANRTFCENLSLTPWHSLAEHRPLGGINRARKAVYQAISKMRHTRNSAPRTEPAAW